MEKSRSDKRKAKNQKRLMIAGVALIAVIAVVVIGINLSSDTASDSNASSKTLNSEVKTFVDANFSTVLIDPKNNKGAKVNISGKVLRFKKKGKIWRIEMYQDPENDDGLTVVESKTDAKVEKGDTVRVVGTVKGEVILKDKDESSIKVPVIEASSLTNNTKPSINDPDGGKKRQDQGMM